MAGPETAAGGARGASSAFRAGQSDLTAFTGTSDSVAAQAVAVRQAATWSLWHTSSPAGVRRKPSWRWVSQLRAT